MSSTIPNVNVFPEFFCFLCLSRKQACFILFFIFFLFFSMRWTCICMCTAVPGHCVTRHKNSQFHSPITTDFYELLGAKMLLAFAFDIDSKQCKRTDTGHWDPGASPQPPLPIRLPGSKGKPLCDVSKGRKSLGSCEFRASLSRPYH